MTLPFDPGVFKGRRILITTARPSCSVARWTCAMEAAAPRASHDRRSSRVPSSPAVAFTQHCMKYAFRAIRAAAEPLVPEQVVAAAALGLSGGAPYGCVHTRLERDMLKAVRFNKAGYAPTIDDYLSPHWAHRFPHAFLSARRSLHSRSEESMISSCWPLARTTPARNTWQSEWRHRTPTTTR